MCAACKKYDGKAKELVCRCSGTKVKMWWSENDRISVGSGILLKEKISENIVEVVRKIQRVMAMVPTKEVMRILRAPAR